MSIEAMKQALEVLTFDGFTPQDVTHRELTAKAVEAFRTAIQQAESEPVAWIYQNEDLVWERFENIDGPSNEYTPLYTHSAPGVPDGVVRDAERYRWLRDFDHWPAPFASSQEPEPVRGADLDAAIDAAIAKAVGEA